MSNIGIVNALIRITFGLTMLAWATAKMTRRPWCASYLIIALLAAMKVGEGITRFCPMTALLENCRREQAIRIKEDATINPT
ncbi:YgaP family membrane protein [Saccharococcus thermophilus]|jgi:hypothetical protein|uniref:Inner membrane protein YgaP-like transmembrane domain-containing protein n=1 Tax=Saccharococcus thermophilus TaxID=29396 RepID=A0A846MLU7_9BACL|nr:DUF2892 domain-containing protein [Saccharococcus thermophilus]NIK16565.1 hypothetical protein [Saccharococcus thermophilus]